MKIALLIIIVPSILFITANAQYFSISPSSKSIDITFDSPKGDRGWSNPYIRDFEIVITNQLNETVTVSVNPSSSSSYIRLISSPSSLNVPALSSGSVRISVQIIDSAADGGSYSGSVRVSSNSHSENMNVIVRTFYPPPTLGFFENMDFGEVATGKSYKGSFTIKELLKFKNANNVKISINPAGPIYDVSASPSTFSSIDSVGRSITFQFKVRERDIQPNSYASTISVSSSNSAYLIDNRLIYTIPRPIFEVSQSQNVNVLEYGKNINWNQMFVISEIGGKTPLEKTGINFQNLIREFKGEKTEYKRPEWFHFLQQVDYIAPANSGDIDINVYPVDAPIGRYTWEGYVKTQYAGDKSFSFHFLVEPPGLEDIKDNLTKLMNCSLVKKHQWAEDFRQKTESLLIEDEKALLDISNVTSMSNVVIKLLNSMCAAHDQNENKNYDEAYENFSVSNEEREKLNRIQLIGNYNPEYGIIKHSANTVWKEVALELINGLTQFANQLENISYQDADYSRAKEEYVKIITICTWLDDNGCVKMISNNISDLNTRIEELMLEADNLKNNISEINGDIHNNTWIFFDTQVIKNPLKFTFFMEKYAEMNTSYMHLSRNYKLVGNQNELNKTQERKSALNKEYESFRLVNSIYLAFLGFILVLMTWKSIQGFIRYGADAKDMKLAEIARFKRISRATFNNSL